MALARCGYQTPDRFLCKNGAWRFYAFFKENEKMIKIIFFFFLVGVLTGCGGDSSNDAAAQTGSTPKEKIAELEISGAIPRLDRSSNIAGVDANANGVRDDIEEFISRNYPLDSQRAAAMQYARGMQSALLVDASDISAVKEVKRQLSMATRCLYSKFGEKSDVKQPASVGSELIAVTTNTKQRLLAYLAYSKALDGASWATPEGDGCE